ncbi:MAG: P1 family peptidase [Acidobacteriota bacterium]
MTLKITDINGIKVGVAQNFEAMTGCTVILAENGATCGVDVRGGAPGTRETDLLDPVNTVDTVHAIVLSGGSAYGLECVHGVMQYLEEHGRGLFTGKTVVPIIPAAVIFDLNVGDHRVRPDKTMGYEAACNAGTDVPEGNFGAGTGATVGKLKGYDNCTKGGQGTFATKLPNGLIVGALVVVNAFGDVVDPEDGRIIAGVQGSSEGGFVSTVKQLKDVLTQMPGLVENTTLAVIVTNARLNKAQCKKVAQMAHNGLAHTIKPVHTMWDGDSVFTLATGEIEVDANMVGVLAQEVLAEAVIRAVKSAESTGCIKCSQEICTIEGASE